MALAKSIPAIRDILVMVKDEIIREELEKIESLDLQRKFELTKITAIQENARKTGNPNEIIGAHRMLARWYNANKLPRE